MEVSESLERDEARASDARSSCVNGLEDHLSASRRQKLAPTDESYRNQHNYKQSRWPFPRVPRRRHSMRRLKW